MFILTSIKCPCLKNVRSQIIVVVSILRGYDIFIMTLRRNYVKSVFKKNEIPNFYIVISCTYALNGVSSRLFSGLHLDTDSGKICFCFSIIPGVLDSKQYFSVVESYKCMGRAKKKHYKSVGTLNIVRHRKTYIETEGP